MLLKFEHCEEAVSAAWKYFHQIHSKANTPAYWVFTAINVLIDVLVKANRRKEAIVVARVISEKIKKKEGASGYWAD